MYMKSIVVFSYSPLRSVESIEVVASSFHSNVEVVCVWD